MKKIRIAFCGVFDLANYGDHLFPIVFKTQMEKRGFDIELVLFSPLKNQQLFNGNIPVNVLKNLEEIHIKSPFDAFVVAGGEIIHLYSFPQKLEISSSEYEKYNVAETWLIPAIVAYKYNKILIWNAPGIPFKFEDEVKNVILSICSEVDYLSVRNDFSRDCLLECGISSDRIKVVPDTALILSESMSIDNLVEIKDNLVPFEGDYVVFHCNRFIKDEQIDAVINVLNNLEKKGYKIILLPLAYTHGDDTVIQRIYELSNKKFFAFEKILSVLEMLSILANCFMYIGVSFHGAITALQYGKKVIAFDYMKYVKTKNLFEYLNIEEQYITDENALEVTVERVLNINKSVNLDQINIRLTRHFDNIASKISMHKDIKKESVFASIFAKGIISISNKIKELNSSTTNYFERIEALNNYIKVLEESNLWYKNELDNILNLNQECRNYIKNLEENINNQNAYINNLQIDHEKKDEYINHLIVDHENTVKYCKHLEENVKKMNAYILSLEETLNWERNNLTKKEAANLEVIEKLNDEIINLRKTIFDIEQSFLWRATKAFRKSNKK